MTDGNGVALVTGASSGIGEAMARRLAGRGLDLVLVARRRDRLAALAERVQTTAEVLPADLTEPEDLARVEERLGTQDRLEFLVNCAGFPGYAPFVEVDPSVVQDLLRIHALAVARLTRAALPGMVARGRGAVINVASLLGLSGPMPPGRMPHRATYAGAKAFQIAFTQALAGELVGTGVKVLVCCPGMVASEFHGPAGLDIPGMVMSAEDVADAALAALDLGETVCVPALEDARMLDTLAALQGNVVRAGNSDTLASRYTGATDT